MHRRWIQGPMTPTTPNGTRCTWELKLNINNPDGRFCRDKTRGAYFPAQEICSIARAVSKVASLKGFPVSRWIRCAALSVRCPRTKNQISTPKSEICPSLCSALCSSHHISHFFRGGIWEDSDDFSSCRVE